MRGAIDIMYDIARLDVDGDMDPGARIGSRSILHGCRWRTVALSNVHRELQSNMVTQTFIQEVHDKLNESRGFFGQEQVQA